MGKDELLHVLHISQCALHSLPLSLSSLRSDSRYSKFITFTVHLYHHCHPQKSCSPSQAHSVVGHVIDHEPPCYLPSLWRSQGTEDLALDMLYNRVWGHLDVNFQLLFFVSEETLKYEPSPLFIDFWAPPPPQGHEQKPFLPPTAELLLPSLAQGVESKVSSFVSQLGSCDCHVTSSCCTPLVARGLHLCNWGPVHALSQQTYQ